jgi:hypothetical protein
MLKRLHAVLEQAAARRGQSAQALLDHLLPADCRLSSSRGIG